MAAKFDFRVLGSSGIAQHGGRIDSDNFMHLRGPRGPALYAEMADCSAIIGAILHLVKTFLRQTPWTTVPSDEADPESRDWAEFVESCRQDMSHTWSDFISEILSMIVYGWSFFEVCYKERNGTTDNEASDSKHSDNMIGWRKFGIRPQNTLEKWEFDAEMGIQGMWQLAPAASFMAGSRGAVLIPIDRGLLFRTESVGNSPQGRSLLRNSVQPYLYVKQMQQVEALGTERDLAGYPVFHVPLSMFSGGSENAAMLAQLSETVCDIRRGDKREGAIIPCAVDADGITGFKLELLTSGGTRALNLDSIIRRYESRMAMPLLAEFILLGTDKVGSFAMHASKSDVFAVSLRCINQSISEVINRYAVTRLCVINGCPPDKIPTVEPGDVAAPPLSDIVAYVQGMASSGMIMHDAATEKWVRQQAGMPDPEPDETSLMTQGDLLAAEQQPEDMSPSPSLPQPAADESTEMP